MKIFILTTDFTAESPPWINIFWPHYNAIRASAPTVLLTTPNGAEEPTFQEKLAERRRRKPDAKRLQATIEAELDPSGPNLLLVWALRRRDIDRATLIEPLWDRFSHKVLTIVDNLQARHTTDHAKGRYDRVTSFCGDLARDYEKTLGIPALHFPPHTDALTFATPGAYRPIDLFLVGRRDMGVWPQIHHHFNAPGRNRLSVDFVSRTRNTRDDSEAEFRGLIGGYGKAKAAFAFDPARLDRFHARSPLTERWVHAWTAGCTVIGSAPTGAGVAEATDWPDSTINLPGTGPEAVEAVEAILADEEGLARRRVRNVAEALRRHDTRHRLARLLDELGIPRTAALEEGLSDLRSRADAIERG